MTTHGNAPRHPGGPQPARQLNHAPQPQHNTPSGWDWDRVKNGIIGTARKVFTVSAVITMVGGGIATYEAIHRDEIALELALDSHDANAVNTARGELDHDRTVLLAEEAGAVALMTYGYVGSRVENKKWASIASASLVAGSLAIASIAYSETNSATAADVAAIQQDIQAGNASAAVSKRGEYDRDVVIRDITTPVSYVLAISGITIGLTEVAEVIYTAAIQ